MNDRNRIDNDSDTQLQIKESFRLRLMIAIPVLTTLLVLGLGLVMIDIGNRELVQRRVPSTMNEFRQNVQETIGHTTVVIVLGGAIAMTAGLALSVAITAPLRSITIGTASVASGDLARTIPLAGEGELAMVGKAFNSMITTMNQYLIQTISGGVLTIDEGAIITSMSSDAEVILGIQSADYIGKPLSHLIPDIPINRDFHHTVSAIINERKTFVCREVRLKTDVMAESLPVSISTSFLRDHDNTLIGLIVSFDDAAHMRRIQERMRVVDRLTSLGSLATNIGLEVQTPLNEIRRTVENMRTKSASNLQLANYSEIMMGDIERVSNVLDRLIRFIQPSASEWRMIPANEIMNEILRLARFEMKNRNITIMEDIEPDMPAILTQEENLMQAILNLIVNAAQALDYSGEIRVASHFTPPHSGASDKGSVVITVTDSGPGIKPDNISRIFTPAFTTKDTGAGFGLAITKQNIETQGGRISVTSDPGVLTVFSVTLPVRDKNELPGDI